MGAPASTSVRTASFAPAGFLISSISSRRSPTAIRSKRPNAAEKRSSPATTSSSGSLERERERRRRERVVDVVEPRQREPDAAEPPRQLERERDAVEPVAARSSRAANVERRPRVPAARAAVVAEVADVGGCVLVAASPQTHAVRRVGGVLERRPRERAGRRAPKTTAGLGAAGEVADERVVAVHDEQRRRASACDGRAPALGDELELAVAVELVAEEVAEAKQRRGCSAPRDLGQRGLVDLEQAELGVAGSEAGWRRRPETRFAPAALWASR